VSADFSELRRTSKPPEDLVSSICGAVDEYTKANPGLTVVQTLSALEQIRFMLTERLIDSIKKRKD
jgi:hypothetical protein